MTQKEYYSRFQDLKNKIENLKNEYIKSLPFKEGDFVRVKHKGNDIEAYIHEVYMPIYNGSGERFNLLVVNDMNDDECDIIPYLKIEDVEVIKQEK